MNVLVVMKLSVLKDLLMILKKTIGVQPVALRLGVSIPHRLLLLRVAASILQTNELSKLVCTNRTE
jgi:hypothetical protein